MERGDKGALVMPVGRQGLMSMSPLFDRGRGVDEMAQLSEANLAESSLATR